MLMIEDCRQVLLSDLPIMTHSELRSAAAIAQTRTRLAELRYQNPNGLRAFVINQALAKTDPLHFWGEYCDVSFVETNMLRLEGAELSGFYETHREEIETIRDQCLRSPHGPVQYEPEFVAQLALENMAFHLRQCLE